ncbi:MAG: mechanosensitive ion channel family protein [Desulfobulbaceae bacterium]|nr:mechanosensitive ion channel family protein [Desulfobulbaceae bacterium]HIJ78929.1 mechanosensitive ion channel family protein [Deltaproteobacteria bacterium]
MNTDTEFFQAISWQSGGVLLIIALGIVIYFATKQCLKRLLAREILTYSVYSVSKNIFRWLLIISVVILVLQHIGIRLNNLVTAFLTVAGMIAIGFIAVWSILSNVLCALMLVIFRNFDIGDEIEIIEPVGGAGLKGNVSNFNLMFTTLTEPATDGGAPYQTQVPNNIFFQKSLRRRPGAKTEGLWQHLITKPLLVQKKN